MVDDGHASYNTVDDYEYLPSLSRSEERCHLTSRFRFGRKEVPRPLSHSFAPPSSFAAGCPKKKGGGLRVMLPSRKDWNFFSFWEDDA